jgi:hypothetical protein
MLREWVGWNEGGGNRGDEVRGNGPKRKTLALDVVVRRAGGGSKHQNWTMWPVGDEHGKSVMHLCTCATSGDIHGIFHFVGLFWMWHEEPTRDYKTNEQV